MSSTSPLLEDLNEPQRDAVLYGDGSLLVLAGAGSGKTRVITRRIGHLVLERDIFPWRILAVTFTNKAAREMRERLVSLLGPRAHDLVVSTFHSAGSMILRREAEHLGLSKSFVIYDDSDQLQVVRRAIREVGLDTSSLNPREILSKIDNAKNHAKLPEDFQVAPGDYRGENIRKVYRAYQRQLKAANAMDFGDLLLQLVHLFQTQKDVLEKYQNRFTHVLVDEFQDTNPVQYRLLQLLAPPGSNVVVVGDDDQSIYRWRGAQVNNILGFPEDYPDTKIVKLEQNYRSDQVVLEAANAVISRNPRRMDKKLWSSRPRGESLKLIITRDERGEAQEVARQIQALVREGTIPYQQVAVFYRTNAQSRVLEEALRLGRVPYTLVSGRSFYDRAEIRDAASYLRLMVNPRSDADLLRVINKPARGIGETTIERLTDAASAQGLSLFDALAGVEEIPTLKSSATNRLKGFRALVEKLGRESATMTDAAQAVEWMLGETGLLAELVAEETDESLARAENLRELIGAAQEFDLTRAAAPIPTAENLAPDLGPLQAFLEQISLVGEADGEVGEGRVALMTLHAAKGLEFDAVFMTGMEDSVFPHSRALKEDADIEELAEERRLCYVGFTRARKRLFVSLAQSRSLFGELKLNPPSRFLRDVPPELFGFRDDVPLDAGRPQTMARPPIRRGTAPRAWDEAPQVDHSYDQRSESYDDGDSVVGKKVRHNQFGEGRVMACDGSGPNAKLTVRFSPQVGIKRVVARFLSPA